MGSLLARSKALATAAVLMGAAGSAEATWSIVLIDTRTGEVCAASATCLTGFDLKANTPVLLVGGASATAQSAVDSNALNRTFIRDQFARGVAPDAILAALSLRDAGHQSRQYGMADIFGRTATFSGSLAGAWAGGRTGTVGSIVYAVQGNVLTGPPVVDGAVAAIINTPGDIPAKMMAAMEAAYACGGDGRCSCTSGPTGCGPCPTGFTKSSHIAYMLGTRAGDRDGSSGAYTLGINAVTAAVGDVDADGKPDFLGAAGTTISVMRSNGIPTAPPSFADRVQGPTGGNARELAAGDLDGDGKADAVFSDTGGDRVGVMRSKGDGGFLATTFFAVGDGPVGVIIADFNKDGLADIATANSNSDSVTVLRNMGGAVFSAPANFPGGDGAAVLRAGDYDGDGDLDIYVAAQNTRSLSVLVNDGAGSFAPAVGTLSFSTAPIGLAAGDLNGDGRVDAVLICNSDGNTRVILSQPDGSLAVTSVASSLTAGASPNIVDLDQDGVPDIVVQHNGAAFLAVHKGLGGGLFEPGVSYPLGFNTNRTVIADFNGDGRPDAATATKANSSVLLTSSNGAAFNKFPNLAGGDYFMDFNIANQTAGALDPVLQLRQQFDAWRGTLVGVPDAVVSEAALDDPIMNADGRATTLLRLHVRDFSGGVVQVLAHDVVVEQVGGPDVLVGPVEASGDGGLQATVTAPVSCGAVKLRATVYGFGRPVVLMPDVSLAASSRADADRDGDVDQADIELFVSWFLTGVDTSDFNGDGFPDAIDFDEFVRLYLNGGGC